MTDLTEVPDYIEHDDGKSGCCPTDLTQDLQRVRPQWVFEPDGDHQDVSMAIIDAARNWSNLTTPENVERVAKVLVLHFVEDDEAYDLDMDDDTREAWNDLARKVLEAIAGSNE